jgi:hypothetical protein
MRLSTSPSIVLSSGFGRRSPGGRWCGLSMGTTLRSAGRRAEWLSRQA